MNILVCFKIERDVSQINEQQWQLAPKQWTNLSIIRRICNCYDETSLELGLRFVEQHANGDKLSAITIDSEPLMSFLQQLVSIGYQNVINMTGLEEEPCHSYTQQHACLLAKYITEHEQQLVLVGLQSGQWGSGQTAFYLAHYLNYLVITHVVNILPTQKEGMIEVECCYGGEIQRFIVKTPAILVIGNSIDVPRLRMSTLKQRLQIKQERIQLISCFSDDQLCEPLSSCVYEAIVQQMSSRQPKIMQMDNEEDIARWILKNGLSG